MRFARLVLLVALSALTACQSPLTAPVTTFQSGNAARLTPGAVIRAHLYVSVASRSASIERFPIIKGIPEEKPDRVYRGYGGLLAVGGDGTLYAALSTDTGDIVVNVFPPNATKPARKIIIPNLAAPCQAGSGGGTAAGGVAADATDHLFVAIYTYAGGARPRVKGGGRALERPVWPCEGVAVYAPRARGEARPIRVIRYGQSAALQGLAVDASDNLYVADYPRKVDEFSNAIFHPQETREFSSDYIAYVHAVATDAAGDVFIASSNVAYRNGRIDRYAMGAKGRGAPTSVISLARGVHLLPSIAEHGRVLYVDDAYSSIDLYHAFGDREQNPFHTLPAPNVSSVAVGR
jgi:hypothetical protein